MRSTTLKKTTKTFSLNLIRHITLPIKKRRITELDKTNEEFGLNHISLIKENLFLPFS